MLRKLHVKLEVQKRMLLNWKKLCTLFYLKLNVTLWYIIMYTSNCMVYSLVTCLMQTWVVKFSILVNVHMPKDRITQLHQGYGFVEFLGEEDADYAIKVMNMIKVYGKPIRVNKVQMLSSLYIITLYFCRVHTSTVITKYCKW